LSFFDILFVKISKKLAYFPIKFYLTIIYMNYTHLKGEII